MSKGFNYLFVITLVVYIVFAAVEEFIPGFISDYFNPHLLIIPVVAFLAALLVVEREKPLRDGAQKTRRSWVLIVLASFATLVILWIGADELAVGWRAVVTVYGGLLVAGILSVLFKE